MSAKGTTWRKSDIQENVQLLPKKDEKLPQWAYELINSLSSEIEILKEQVKTLKNDNSN